MINSVTMKTYIIIKILVITMIVAFLPSLSTYAQFSGGNGSEEEPYLITTAQQLAQLATFVNAGDASYNSKCYKLENDIDLSDYQSGTGWTPIGKFITNDNNQPFKGFFDGDNHKIYGLKIINNAAFDDAGLFGFVSDCTIKNIGIENANIESYNETSCAGGIASLCVRSNITHCYFKGDITNTATMNISYVGGIAGYGNESHFSNCCSSGTINGIANSFMNHLCSTGGVVGGCDNGSVSNCFSIASVVGVSTGACSVGGVVGYGFGSSYVNCYSTGAVSGTVSVDGYNSMIGGIVGSCYDEMISNCAALNPGLDCNSSSSIMIGRINGSNYGVTLSNNIAFDGMLNHLGNTTWTPIGATTINGTDISVEEINADGTLGGRFTDANGWITQNGKLPDLFGNPIEMPEHLQLPGTPPTITTHSMPNGTVGVAYSQLLEATGDATIIWTIETGNLPPELTLSEDGLISGTPVEEGIFHFTVKATNSTGSDTKELSILIEEEIGILEMEWANIQVFPNPTTGELQVTIAGQARNDGELRIGEIEIFDIYGRRVKVEKSPSNFEGVDGEAGRGSLILNISHLTDGLYFLKIQTDNGIVTKKIIKQ
jgi:hypothetical protein